MASSITEIPHLSNDIAGQNRISYEEIARKLIDEKFLLTALELHAELCETDRELPILKDFFSNPSNFELQSNKPETQTPMLRSSSQATLDSLDMTRFSEDGGGVDDRVAVLEFELRKARENINALRANLTVVAESDGGIFDKKNSEKHSTNEHPIQPHEQRALNFLINEFLLSCSYKLTSITFSDENEDQDFEDWQDVGLNIPKPPGLLQIYRDFHRSNDYDKPMSCSVSAQTENLEMQDINNDQHLNELVEDNKKLQEKINALEEEKLQLLVNPEYHAPEQHFDTTQNTNSDSTSPDKFELLECLPQDISNFTHEPEEENDNSSVVVSFSETDPGDNEWMRIRLSNTKSDNLSSTTRYLPKKFQKEVLNHCCIDTSRAVSNLLLDLSKSSVTQETLVHISAQTLIKVIPNILLNKREDSIPLILCTFVLHEAAEEREKLLQLLFNLKKKPQDDERQAILAGLQSLFEIENATIELEEILTLCWEQSQHKYLERRLLAAECCSVLASYASSNIRNSLMISMLQQMLLEDKEASVRTVVVKSLALLVALMDDPDKYFQCEELSITALDDLSSSVVDAAIFVFLPILAQWALDLNRLLSHLLPRIISKLISQLKSLHQYHSLSKDYSDTEKSITFVKVLQLLLPHLIVNVVNNEIVISCVEPNTSSELPPQFVQLCQSKIVNPEIFYEADVNTGILLNSFYSHTWKNNSWIELEWLTNKLIPEIVEMLKLIDAVSQENLLIQVLIYIKSLCTGFGEDLTRKKIQPVFKESISELEHQLMELNSDLRDLKLSLIPAYLTVLSTLSDRSELMNSLKHFLVALAISGASASSLRVAILILSNEMKLSEHVLVALWDGVVHQRPNVKCLTASLFSCLIPHVGENLLATKIVPAIVTLANDADLSVRAAAILALGQIINEGNVKEAKDKARMTLETIAKEHKMQNSAILDVPLVLTFSSIAPNCPQNYIEDVVAVQLNKITSNALHQSHKKINLTNALVEAYSSLAYCTMSDQCMAEVLLPGLNCLDILCNQVIPQQNTVRSLIKEIEQLVQPKTLERSTSASSGLSLSMATVNVGQGMEDMRQKMSKIFHQKSNSPGMSNFFRKK